MGVALFVSRVAQCRMHVSYPVAGVRTRRSIDPQKLKNL